MLFVLSGSDKESNFKLKCQTEVCDKTIADSLCNRAVLPCLTSETSKKNYLCDGFCDGNGTVCVIDENDKPFCDCQPGFSLSSDSGECMVCNDLLEATEAGNLDCIQKLFNSENQEKIDSAMQNAVKYGDIQILEFFLENGANVSAVDENGRQAIHLAAIILDFDVFEILLRYNASINARDADGNTPLILAVQGLDHQILRKKRSSDRSRSDIIAEIIRNGGNVHAHNKWKRQAIHEAVLFDNIDVISILVKNGADVEAKDENGDTPLIHASRMFVADTDNEEFRFSTEIRRRLPKRGRPEMLEAIIENGADVKSHNDWGRQPVHAASFYGNIDALEILMKHGGSLSVRDINGNTAILDATRGEEEFNLESEYSEVSDLRRSRRCRA